VRRAAGAVFGLLVVATLAAFYVAQDLKTSPSVVQAFRFPGIFSPNQDGRRETVPINVRLREADDVTLTILDDGGDPVRTLVDDVALPAYRQLRPTPRWDGRDDAGRLVPDGRYRVRLTLRRQGRTVIRPRSIVKDTRAPRIVVFASEPAPGTAPEILPDPQGRKVTWRFAPVKRVPRVRLFRTAPGVRELLVQDLRPGATSWSWDGRVGGRPVAPGTFAVSVEWRDRAGNRGTSIPLQGDLPAPRGRFGGRGGVTVRYVGVQVPGAAVRAGDRVAAFVDARRRRYRWTLRRVGTRRPLAAGSGTRAQLTPAIPRDEPSGLLVLTVRVRGHATSVPVAVQARRAVRGTPPRPRGTLVVLPYETWQGRNPLDEDGDGAPNTLERGVGAGLERILAGGLPAGVAEREAPALAWLGRTGRRFDLTADLALERADGDPLAGYRGVLIPGDAVWLTPRVRQRLRAFVRRGGRLMSLGTGSLQQVVDVSRSGRRLVRPRRTGRTDLFGATLAPPERRPTDLEVSPLPDEIGLFRGTAGSFPDAGVYERTLRLGSEADALAAAVTVQPPGRTVIVAAGFGRGLVIRPGMPDFAARLSAGGPYTALMERSWTLLSR
jgi:hypothetical protein